ncbi:beta-lactamase-like protein [Mycena vulgaris]|nr:beta-lactamase-like protein [Mycena vulgaris]
MHLRVLPCLSFVFLLGGTYASFHDFGIPPSDATVDVRVFNVGNLTLTNSTHTFFLPVLPGRESVKGSLFAFLVEHKKTQKRLMFDLGLRKDPLNLAPSIAGLFSSGVGILEESKDITEQLRDGGIALASIDTVIWSHAHFDHIGDMSKFPNTTGLVIGPGTDTTTFPEFSNAALRASDLAGHNITELNFAGSRLTFSGLKAIDWFNDGSFYLLETPGHHPGHITALARVTPTSFITLGGDTFHYAGEARPRPQFQKNFPCPAHLLEEIKTSISTDYFWSPGSREGAFDMRSRAQQLLAISDLPDSLYDDPVASQVSLEKLATFDADPDFFVVVAHDLSLVSSLPFFPASLNGWKASHLKERTVWNFIEKANPAFIYSPTNQTGILIQ